MHGWTFREINHFPYGLFPFLQIMCFSSTGRRSGAWKTDVLQVKSTSYTSLCKRRCSLSDRLAPIWDIVQGHYSIYKYIGSWVETHVKRLFIIWRTAFSAFCIYLITCVKNFTSSHFSQMRLHQMVSPSFKRTKNILEYKHAKILLFSICCSHTRLFSRYSVSLINFYHARKISYGFHFLPAKYTQVFFVVFFLR